MRIKALFLALLLVPSLAFAGTNIKQNADGTASWVDTPGNTYPIREVHLNTRLTDVSTAATAYVVSPATNLKVTSIRAVIGNTVAGSNSVLRAGVMSAAGAVVRVFTPATVAVVATSVTGTVFTLSPTSSNAIEAGQSVFIYTDGGSTNVSETNITVTLSPRS